MPELQIRGHARGPVRRNRHRRTRPTRAPAEPATDLAEDESPARARVLRVRGARRLPLRETGGARADAGTRRAAGFHHRRSPRRLRLKGHREPLISFETFRTIQDRLAGNAKTPARKNLSADFPLRGSVVCGHCGTPLTACWTKGKYSRFPYYLCPRKGCESYGKSIRRATIEGEFETLLHDLRPAPELFSVARAMFEDLWNDR